MAAGFLERVKIVVITATVVSAAWITVGSVYFDLRPGQPEPETVEPEPPVAIETFVEDAAAPGQDTVPISRPDQSDTAQLMIPVLDVSAGDLVDTFTDERGAGVRLHEAIDIMAPEGTSVVAAAPGTIERLFRSDAGGNTIYVRSDDGETIHYYAHLAEYAPGLQEDQKVRRGQRLGTVGSTGNASPEAPHLHFAIMRTTADAQWWEPATALNPYPMLAGKTR